MAGLPDDRRLRSYPAGPRPVSGRAFFSLSASDCLDNSQPASLPARSLAQAHQGPRPRPGSFSPVTAAARLCLKLATQQSPPPPAVHWLGLAHHFPARERAGLRDAPETGAAAAAT